MNKLVIANWKMRLSLNTSVALAQDFCNKFKDFSSDGNIVVCPDFVALTEVNKIFKDCPNLILGAQDVFWEEEGEYTGEVSIRSLKESGCEYIILGHSERRRHLLENFIMINKKLKLALNTVGMIPVVCVGESWEDRKTDRRDFVLFEQLDQALSGVHPIGDQKIVIAYEPIWAIGTGTAVEPEEEAYAHKVIKLLLKEKFGEKIFNDCFKIIYGGSVNQSNVDNLLSHDDIDGFLVGTASLKADDFLYIAKALFKK